MIRRRFALYTVMLTAGILAGYFIMEKKMLPGGIGFIAAMSAAALFYEAEGDSLYHSRAKKGKIACLLFLLTGVTLFSTRYSAYETAEDRCLSMNDASGGPVALRGKVLSASLKDDRLQLIVKSDDGGRVRLTLSVSTEHPADEMLSGKAYLLPGARIRAYGEYRALKAAEDPGCFDERIYMRAKGVSASFKAVSTEVTDMGRGRLTLCRRELYRAREQFISCFDEESSGFIRGVIFGDKSEIDEELRREFNTNSTGHILAVSGLHIGFLYSLLRILLGRKRTLTASLLIIFITIIYGEMTCWSAPTVRACIVMALDLFSLHLRKPFDMLTSVSFAAFLILIRQPYQLFDAGFRMTFLAMLSIAFLAKPLSAVLGETMGVMLSVQIGIAPVSAYTFYRFNALSLIINIPIVLLSSVLVPVCIVLLVVEMITGAVPAAGIAFAELISFAVMKINHLLNFEGAFSTYVAGSGAAAAALFYAAVFFLSSEWLRVQLIRKNRKETARMILLLLMPLVIFAASTYDTFSDDEIIFVSVGQGDCTHIRANGRDLLIDGGGSEDYSVGEMILVPYLLHEGADTVTAALATHLHTDHYKGICELCSELPVGFVGIPADYRDAGPDALPDTDPERIRYIGPDSEIRLSDDVYIETIWPVRISHEPLAASDPNEHNTVYMIHYKGIRVMVTGDLLEEDELEMIEHYKHSKEGLGTLKCDVLKVAHHGSKSSSSEAFLDVAAPSIAVIQAGRNNFYGHPHQQTLDRLDARGIPVYRTDLNGAIGIDIRGPRINIDVMND